MSYRDLPPIGDLPFAFGLLKDPKPDDGERDEMRRLVWLYSNARAELGTTEAELAHLRAYAVAVTEAARVVVDDTDNWRQGGLDVKISELREALAKNPAPTSDSGAADGDPDSCSGEPAGGGGRSPAECAHETNSVNMGLCSKCGGEVELGDGVLVARPNGNPGPIFHRACYEFQSGKNMTKIVFTNCDGDPMDADGTPLSARQAHEHYQPQIDECIREINALRSVLLDARDRLHDIGLYQYLVDRINATVAKGSDGEEVRSFPVGGAQLAQTGGDVGGMPLSVGRSRPDKTATFPLQGASIREDEDEAHDASPSPKSGDIAGPAACREISAGLTTQPPDHSLHQVGKKPEPYFFATCQKALDLAREDDTSITIMPDNFEKLLNAARSDDLATAARAALAWIEGRYPDGETCGYPPIVHKLRGALNSLLVACTKQGETP